MTSTRGNTIFPAGASGAIGMRLVPLLVQAGYSVTGATRSDDGARRLAALGVEPAIVDVFDLEALESPPLQGTVLRYGHFYGPGTGAETPAAAPRVHVDAAASAALLAAQSPQHGIYNIAEPSEYLVTERAQRELGWDPSFRLTGGGVAGRHAS